MESFVSTFHIDWKIIIAQAINFAVVVFVLYRFAIKPLKKNLDERKNTIEKGLSDAKTNAELLVSAKNDYEKMLAEARTEADKIMKGVKKDAEAKRAELLAAAEAEVATVTQSARKDMEAEKNKMLQDAKKELAGLVVSAAEKVLGGTVTKSIDAKLVEEAVEKVS
ncbi:MAG: F0F1 ATP synthase subunit B [Candidatus Pacebacteria bacterium]|nr:F0F1 ATP synthase subunit B [Candidatus Paceibacterota bacterium]MBP9851953.1 F0F1 ATP synthase subunit B [Candidatus Paceibacterota bacterium]